MSDNCQFVHIDVLLYAKLQHPWFLNVDKRYLEICQKLCLIIVFECRFCCIDFIAQCPILKRTDVAPKIVLAKHTTTKNMSNIMQPPHTQHEVQHIGLTILVTTNNRAQFPLSSLTAPKKSVTESRTQPFDQTSSLAGGKNALASRMSNPHLQTTHNHCSINHCWYVE